MPASSSPSAISAAEGPGETERAFAIDPFRKHCLIEGVDELAFTLGQRDRIAAFEDSQSAAMPWL